MQWRILSVRFFSLVEQEQAESSLDSIYKENLIANEGH